MLFAGKDNGTCAIIEKTLNRKLIWLPCRHHISEILLRGIFEVYWNTTTGPNVPFFARFKTAWDKIDQKNYISGLEDKVVAEALAKERAEIINFINSHLEVNF